LPNSYFTRFEHFYDNLLIRYQSNKEIRQVRRKVKGESRNYHIIYRDSRTAGFFSNLYVFFSEIEYAAKHNLIPVIDTLNFPDQFGSGSNTWELVYQQPESVTLHEAYYSKNPSHSYGCRFDNGLRLNWDMNWLHDQPFCSYKKQLFNKYIRLQPQVESHIKNLSSLISNPSATLGVMLRGTDYTNQEPRGHPVQPKLDYILDRCRQIIDHTEISSIYLVTIDNDILAAFKSSFGSRLLVLERRSYHSEVSDLFAEISRSEDHVQHLLSYVTSVYLLRECKHVISGVTSATPFIPFISDFQCTYEFPFLGFYGINS